MPEEPKKGKLAVLMAMSKPGESAMGAPEPSPVEEPVENTIQLPKGFKPPSGVSEDGTITTTVRGRIQGDMLIVEAIGDMPLNGVPEEPSPAPTPETDYGEQANQLFGRQ